MKRFNFLHSDINDKKKKELVDILLAYQQAIDINIISSITDPDGIILYANNNFCEISQYSREELLGQSHNIINSGFHPKAFFSNLWRTIKSGQVWHGEIRNRAKDGSFYWVDTVILPVLNAEGEITQYLSLRTLITDKKQAEEERKEYTRKLRELLVMTSHSLRRPLANCIGLMSHMEEDPMGPGEREKVMEYLKSSAMELDQFTKDLTAFIIELNDKYDKNQPNS